MLMDIFFPRRCPVCDGVLSFGGERIHKDCVKRLKKVGVLHCATCGRPVRDSEEFCHACRTQRHDFDGVISVYIYNDAMRSSIYRFKYAGRQEYAAYYGRELAAALLPKRAYTSVDLIIPVPLFEGKLKARGYNQAELLAAEMSKLLHIPMSAGLVKRVRATRAQKELTAAERRKNLKKAFKMGKDDVKLDSVLVVDDIFTTGSTLDEVAGVLKSAGVRRVYGVTLATGKAK